jgi:hypothetical protein
VSFSLRTEEGKRWAMVVLFGVAMAWMEAATVVYLRMLVDRVIPYQSHPLPPHDLLGNTELVREVSTLLMLSSVGWLAGRNPRSRVCYALLAFGVWDIFYYAFLRLIVGWPQSLWDWDVLFLLPLPWWGPVLAPVAIAVLLIVGATLVTQSPEPVWPAPWALLLTGVGALLALGVFMSDALRALPGGEAAVRATLPARFPWPWFMLALALMAASVADLARQAARHS